MGLAQRSEHMTAEAFIAWENEQADKHEFLAGEVYAMVGARRVHVTISLNVAALLKAHLRGGPCRAYMADMKLAVLRPRRCSRTWTRSAARPRMKRPPDSLRSFPPRGWSVPSGGRAELTWN